MKEKFLWTIVAILTYCLGTSCSKDGDIIYLPDPNEQKASTAPLVTVVYDAEGVGDQSYNDLIYRGVEEAAVNYGLRTLQLSPLTNEEGLADLERLIQQMSTANDTIRRLCIVASPVYDEFVRKNSSRLESNPRADLLYLETTTPLQGKGSTLYLPYYGAMYEAGNIASFFASNVTLFAANPVNESVAEAVKGFSDGFKDRQGETAGDDQTDYDDIDEGPLKVHYLGEKAGDGFAIEDETAFELLKEYEVVSPYDHLIVPICGGAASTFSRLVDITSAYTYMGVDCAQNSVFSPYSAVKHIDRAVAQCISQWLSAEGMPKHQSLGLASGYTDVVLHPYNNYYKTLVDENLTTSVMNEIRQQAIRKEEAYGK